MSLMEKPQAMAKMHRLYRSIKKNGGRIGTNLRVLELVYSNACNFKCEHCSTRAPLGENADVLMPLDKVAELADELLQGLDVGVGQDRRYQFTFFIVRAVDK